MRMPGREADLVAGFLAAEQVLRHPEDLLAVEACPDPVSGAPAPNVWNAALSPGVAFDPRVRRFATVPSSCGLCGTRTLEDLEREVPVRPERPAELAPGFLAQAMAGLSRRQPVFERTAGVHAAGLLGLDGTWLDAAEDVGRHNAVDKLLGAALLAGDYPLERPAWLLVSGRVSYEIVLKAALAGIGGLAGAGMPTSMAVEAARACGLRLHAFVREDGGLRYSPAE